MRSPVWILGAACGLVWWVISLLLGARVYGIPGTHLLTGAVAGVVTGIGMTALAAPLYRLYSPRILLWYSPLSAYLGVALYGILVFAIRSLIGDFHPDQLPWAVGLQSILGMWWGITFLLPIAIPVHLIAYATHRLLRSILLAGAASHAY